MSHLWSGRPISVRLDDLDVICAVLGCDPGDLLIRDPDRGQGSRPGEAAAAADARRSGPRGGAAGRCRRYDRGPGRWSPAPRAGRRAGPPEAGLCKRCYARARGRCGPARAAARHAGTWPPGCAPAATGCRGPGWSLPRLRRAAPGLFRRPVRALQAAGRRPGRGLPGLRQAGGAAVVGPLPQLAQGPARSPALPGLRLLTRLSPGCAGPPGCSPCATRTGLPCAGGDGRWRGRGVPVLPGRARAARALGKRGRAARPRQSGRAGRRRLVGWSATAGPRLGPRHAAPGPACLDGRAGQRGGSRPAALGRRTPAVPERAAPGRAAGGRVPHRQGLAREPAGRPGPVAGPPARGAARPVRGRGAGLDRGAARPRAARRAAPGRHDPGCCDPPGPAGQLGRPLRVAAAGHHRRPDRRARPAHRRHPAAGAGGDAIAVHHAQGPAGAVHRPRRAADRPPVPPPPVLPLDDTLRARLLGRLHEPAERLIVLLAGVHALRPGDIAP